MTAVEDITNGLSQKMKTALQDVDAGIRGYYDGLYHPLDDPRRTVGKRTLDALFRRELIDWYTTGGNPHFTTFRLTELGKLVLEQVEEEEYQERRQKRGW